MIEKQRLEELIEQGATIYGIKKDFHIIDPSKIVKIEEIKSYLVTQYKEQSRWDKEYTSNTSRLYEELFETKEDAEFALRFKRIPRTEYLDLPTWEEFIQGDKQVIIYDKDKTYYLDKVMNKTHIIIGYKCLIDLNEELEANRYNFYRKPLIKENYIEACKLVKKLFLGEEI